VVALSGAWTLWPGALALSSMVGATLVVARLSFLLESNSFACTCTNPGAAASIKEMYYVEQTGHFGRGTPQTLW
jgi:hypothetical protein